MRILLTNNALSGRSGTELYTREVARELKARGHEPMAFSLSAGALAGELRKKGIPVVEDLALLPCVPEVIHGHHCIETTLVAMIFPKVPVLSFCHGPEAWQEAPCRLPNVVGWVAVDDACRKRLIEEEAVPADRVTVLLNFVDGREFPRRGPLPSRPRRALVFSNYMSASHPIMKMIEAACREHGIELEGRGAGFGSVCDNPGKILPEYDLVFAKARCALEAMACGCAVVQADYFGVGQLVRSGNFDHLRRLNFGIKSMTAEASAAYISSEIAKYDPDDAAAVSARVRSEASLEATVDQLIEWYRAAAGVVPPEFDPMREAADFLRFHLFLSKLPVEALRKTTGLPLRLPVPPLGPSLEAEWKRMKEGHESNQERKLRILEAKLEHVLAKNKELKARLAKRHKVELSKPTRTGWRAWFPFF